LPIIVTVPVVRPSTRLMDRTGIPGNVRANQNVSTDDLRATVQRRHSSRTDRRLDGLGRGIGGETQRLQGGAVLVTLDEPDDPHERLAVDQEPYRSAPRAPLADAGRGERRRRMAGLEDMRVAGSRSHVAGSRRHQDASTSRRSGSSKREMSP
jgi:hypothetical protein